MSYVAFASKAPWIGPSSMGGSTLTTVRAGSISRPSLLLWVVGMPTIVTLAPPEFCSADSVGPWPCDSSDRSEPQLKEELLFCLRTVLAVCPLRFRMLLAIILDFVRSDAPLVSEMPLVWDAEPSRPLQDLVKMLFGGVKYFAFCFSPLLRRSADGTRMPCRSCGGLAGSNCELPSKEMRGLFLALLPLPLFIVFSASSS
mmetsp:Transcript_31148/g.56890  ORF Transcript_31148/g.56890 Transcript_31148/m.56890 type:complete len:200 (-) Transcript_31148:887-1486(-)